MQSWHRKNINRDTLGPYIGRKQHGFERSSLRSRRLELVGTRKNGRAKMRHARGEGCQIIRLGAGNDFRGPSGQALPHPSRVSLRRARSLFRPLLPSICFEGYERGDISGKKNVEDNENFKLLWDFSKQIDKKLDHNRPDIVFVDKPAEQELPHVTLILYALATEAWTSNRRKRSTSILM